MTRRRRRGSAIYTPKKPSSVKIAEIKQNFTQTNMETAITCSLDSLLNNLPNFEGKKEQDIDFFIKQFEQIADASKLAPSLKTVLIKAKLAGHAKQILINSPELRDCEDFDILKNELKKLFEQKRNFAEIQQKFSTLTQLPTQTIDDFVKMFNISAQKFLAVSGHSSKAGAKDLLDTIKLTKFTQALRPDIAFELQKIGPETFEEAVKNAKKIELAFINKKEINSVTNTQENNHLAMSTLLELNNAQAIQLNDLKMEINAIKAEHEKKNNIAKHQTNNQQESKKQDKFCHICSTESHNTDQCYYNKKNNKQRSNNLDSRNRQNFQNQNYFRPRNNYQQRFQFRPRQHEQRPRYVNPDYYAQNTFRPGWGYVNQQFPLNYNQEQTNSTQTHSGIPQITYPNDATQSATQSAAQVQHNVSATPNLQQNPHYLN